MNPYVLSDSEVELPKRSVGCAIFGWVAIVALAVFLGWFGYRVWFYYGKLQSGEIVDLPQYTERFTSERRVTPGAMSTLPITIEEVTGKGRPSMGPETAPLTVTIFADFECPFSKDAYTGYRALMAQYGDRVRFIYREYPLESVHPNSVQAALAAECANEQGRFWAYHDKLFLNAPSFGFEDLVRYGDEAGLDGRKFELCLAEGRYRDIIDTDSQAAIALGVRGTPTYFFNGRVVEGAVPQDALEALIKKFIK